jgi:hypothetical protein
MPITTIFDHQHRRVIAQAEGSLTLEEIRDHLEEDGGRPNC